jgi:hypothetical protein
MSTADVRTAAGDFLAVQNANVPANASDVMLGAPAAPTLIVPANAADGITVTTPFTWSAFTGGVHKFELGAQGAPNFINFTEKIAATITDLSAVGFPLPASTQYGWSVDGLAPLASVDAIAALGTTRFFAGNYVFGASHIQYVTTAP